MCSHTAQGPFAPTAAQAAVAPGMEICPTYRNLPPPQKSAPHTEISPTHRNLPHAAQAKCPDRQHFQLGNPVRGESFDLNLGML